MTGSLQTLSAVAAQAALNRKAENLVGLDMREVTSFADEFILATGTSNRHVRAVADAVQEEAKAFGRRPLGTEGYNEGRWILIDFGDVIVHIFQEEVREYYDLERLWSEAPALDLASMGVELPVASSTGSSTGSSTEPSVGPDTDGPGRDVPQTNRSN